MTHACAPSGPGCAAERLVRRPPAIRRRAAGPPRGPGPNALIAVVSHGRRPGLRAGAKGVSGARVAGCWCLCRVSALLWAVALTVLGAGGLARREARPGVGWAGGAAAGGDWRGARVTTANARGEPGIHRVRAVGRECSDKFADARSGPAAATGPESRGGCSRGSRTGVSPNGRSCGVCSRASENLYGVQCGPVNTGVSRG